MTYLLDTNVWLLLRTAPDRVDAGVRERLEDLPEAPDEDVPAHVRADGVGPLPVSHAHTLRVASPPLHHRDPFDRLLVAQAQVDALVLVTRDRAPERDEVDVLPA